MVELLDGLHIVRTYSSAEEERNGNVVSLEQTPIVFVAAATIRCAFGVENEAIHHFAVWLAQQHIGVGLQTDGFPYTYLMVECPGFLPDLRALLWRLVAMKLYDVKSVGFNMLQDVCCIGIDKHTNTFGMNGHVVWRNAYKTSGAGIKDESHVIYA